MKAKRKKSQSDPAEGQFDGGKIEGRLTAEEAEALAAYMGDRFLTNKSDVLRSALAQFLVREGYLEMPAKPGKRGAADKSDKKSTRRGWGKLVRRVALIMTAAVGLLSTSSALSSPINQRSVWRMTVADGHFRRESGEQAPASGGGLAERARDVKDWFLDLEPGYQTAVVVTSSVLFDLMDGKLELLGGLQVW